MNPEEVKQVLMRYRPGRVADPNDGEMIGALEEVQRNEELRQWFTKHCEFQESLKDAFRSIQTPAELKKRLIQQFPKSKPQSTTWTLPQWLAAAASILIIIGLAGYWLGWEQTPDRFADYRTRMVRSVLREYRLDVRSSDMQAVRQFMSANGAPDDFVIPGGLSKLPLVGGGFLRWRNHPVAMICFGQSDARMSYLFVLDRAHTPDAPPSNPEIVTVNGRSSAAWTAGNRIYLLMGSEGVDARTLQ